jgi:cytochrome c oxidase cbb3-type subunit 3
MTSLTRLFAAGLVATITILTLNACERIDDKSSAGVTREVQARTHHEIGRQVYNFRCYYCHGYSGDAQTLAATFLKPAPRNFRDSRPEDLPREQMVNAITHGRAGTAMKGFGGTLTPIEIAAVADFVVEEFARAKAHNTHYHTPANGWREHERYKSAFPFATGKIALDAGSDTLSAEEREGKKLFMNACISCHDRAKVNTEGAAWAIRPVTYPPDFYLLAESGRVKENAAFDPHHAHEKAPKLRGLTNIEKRGERLYQQNCAFCHAADGTGRNWIGSFLEPNATDFTSAKFAATAKQKLAAVIADGIDGTSMPAWKHVLAEPDINAVAAYVLRAFPAAASPTRRGAAHPELEVVVKS